MASLSPPRRPTTLGPTTLGPTTLGLTTLGLVFAVTASVGACDDHASPTGSGGGDATTVGSTSGAGAAGGHVHGGGGLGAQELVDIPGKAGRLRLAAGPTSLSIDGLFVDYGDTKATTVYANDGPCRVILSSEPLSITPETPVLGAGDLTVTTPHESFVISPDGGNLYAATIRDDQPLVAPGDVVTVSFSGDEVPAFELPITASPALVLTSHDAAEPSTAPRTDDLVVTWEPVAGAIVSVTLIGAPSGEAERIFCAAPASAGGLTLPRGLIARLAAGPATLVVDGGSRESAIEGPWDLQVTLHTGTLHEIALELE